MRAFLVGLEQADGGAVGVVSRLLAGRGHMPVACTVESANLLRPHDGRWDLVVIGGGEAVRACSLLRSSSFAVNAVILALVDDPRDDEPHGSRDVQALLDAGADDVATRPGEDDPRGNRLLAERLRVAERTANRGAARSQAEAKREHLFRDLTENLSTTLNSIGDGVIACDLDGNVVRMNPMAEVMTGWAFAEAAARPLTRVFRIVNAETRVPVDDPVARALRAGSVVELPSHSVLLRRDGTELHVSDSCSPIRQTDASVTGVVLVFRNVSAEHEAKVARANVERQQALADRLASLGTLARGMAHEINNPLAAVIANLDLILEHLQEGGPRAEPTTELEEMTKEARHGAERVQAIVRGLKAFSGAEPERRVVLDLAKVLKLSIELTANEVRHRARLVTALGETPLVEADEARLCQVFIHLLLNAAKALPEGNAEANEIRVVTGVDPGGGARIEIRDTGPGISKAILGRIFDPFFTTKPVGVATGLGLSICQNTVRGLGGTLTAESEEGRGATFRVVLPAASVQRPRASAVAPSEPKGAGGAAVLIVDDDPAVGRSLGRILRDDAVTIVTRGSDALSILAEGKQFDVIFSDLMMPEMSGMDLHEELQRRFPVAARRVVFMTGGAFSPAASQFLERATNGRLDKPFDLSAVRAMMRSLQKDA